MRVDGRKAQRRYSPKIEALEALRMLDAASAGLLPLAAERATLPSTVAPPEGIDASPATWDLALDQADLADLLPSLARVEPADATAAESSPAAVESGLNQMSRYLARTWARAGVPLQQADDCTQAVYATLLQNLGRDEFDRVLSDVGTRGIPQVLSRETEFGPDFFRAIDMVKKRALRQKSHLALDDQVDVAAPVGSDGASEGWKGALQEAISRSLNTREADLIQATLMGFSPAEIASQWGVAPKTVSNEKTRALAKLRTALIADLDA